MKYTLNKDCYSNPNIIKLNALKERSYFIPYPSRKSLDGISLLDKRYKSSKVICLNGEWDFKHYDNPNRLGSEFDTSLVKFDTIDVPSCIEYRGYSKPEYINARYNFNFNPPKIPTTKPVSLYYSHMTGLKFASKDYYNHVSVYRKMFDIADLDKIYILSFLGVCSCFELYCNSSFVGYAEESHNTSEFDITSYLKEGINEILVVVHRWCNGSYLECQDMFRNTGIFRDVLLRVENKDDIYDIDIDTYKHDDLYDLTVTIDSREEVDCKVSLKINKEIIVKSSLNKGINEIKFTDLTVEEWNSDFPKLYDLYIEKDDFCVKEEVGFKDIKIVGNKYYLNGSLVKFFGVNHHDTSPVNGYTLTSTEIERDLKLAKEYNCNIIRTSHYAPDPVLIELASEIGLYIIDEVDLETHGAFFQGFPPSMSLISNNKIFTPHYISRVKSHFSRDKINKTPIVMWSLGNESGGGINIIEEYKWLKEKTDIPIHYEGVTHDKIKALDIASEMYPEVSNVNLIGEMNSKTKEFNDRPYFLCEYAHAMGVGPGNIEGYMNAFLNHDNLLGGCIWEMVDHSVLEDNEYTYGGDHKEFIHDSNFCCDGLFYPDRTPSTGAYIMKYAYRPIRITHIEEDKYEIFNTKSFRDSSSYDIEIIAKNETFKIDINVLPLQRNLFFYHTDEDMIDVKVTDKFTNNVVSYETIVLNNNLKVEYNTSSYFPKWFKFEDEYPLIRTETFRMECTNPYTELFRSSTDNDKILFFIPYLKKWYKEKEIKLSHKLEQGLLTIDYKLKVGLNVFEVTDTYQALKNGVLVHSILKPKHASGYIPRFNKTFKLDRSFNNVKYFGREKESYIDMKDHSPINEYKTTVLKMVEPNIKPQESGNRMDTRYVEISNYNSRVRFTALDKPFELGIKPYSDKELIKMKHRKDELRTGTYVSINAFNQGIGTGSCGPSTLKEHKYNAKDTYELKFIIEVFENE